MKIIHFINDEKFIDAAMSFFDDVGCENTFICIVSSLPYDLLYIKNKSRVNLVLDNDVLNILHNVEVYDMVCFHSLPITWYKYVLEVPKEKEVMWSSFGFDIYYPMGGCPAIHNMEIYKPITKKLYGSQRTSLFGLLKTIVKWSVLPIRQYRIYSNNKKKREELINFQTQVVQRIDFCSTILQSEFALIKDRLKVGIKYYPSPYISRNINIVKVDVDKENADYILVGNSADPSNNHLDVLRLISKRKINNKIYMPLAYGNGKNKLYLIELFANNDKYIIQDTFVARDEYDKILKKCRVAVMGHTRQQAIGNILYFLAHGLKVFLYRESITYKFFKEKGVYVFSIEDDLCQEEIDAPLEDFKMDFNIRFVLSNWDYDERVSMVRNIINV